MSVARKPMRDLVTRWRVLVSEREPTASARRVALFTGLALCALAVGIVAIIQVKAYWRADREASLASEEDARLETGEAIMAAPQRSQPPQMIGSFELGSLTLSPLLSPLLRPLVDAPVIDGGFSAPAAAPRIAMLAASAPMLRRIDSAPKDLALFEPPPETSQPVAIGAPRLRLAALDQRLSEVGLIQSELAPPQIARVSARAWSALRHDPLVDEAELSWRAPPLAPPMVAGPPPSLGFRAQLGGEEIGQWRSPSPAPQIAPPLTMPIAFELLDGIPDEPAPDPADLDHDGIDEPDLEMAEPMAAVSVGAAPDPAPERPEAEEAEPAEPANPAPAPAIRSRVVIYYFGVRDRAVAEQAAASLGGARFGRVELRPVSFTVARTHARYFHAGDRSQARRVANALSSGGGGVGAHNSTRIRPAPAPGTIEVWIAP